MDSLFLTEVPPNLDHLIDHIAETDQPMIIKGTQNDVIMISKKRLGSHATDNLS